MIFDNNVETTLIKSVHAQWGMSKKKNIGEDI
jgi:hypothetical protein